MYECTMRSCEFPDRASLRACLLRSDLAESRRDLIPNSPDLGVPPGGASRRRSSAGISRGHRAGARCARESAATCACVCGGATSTRRLRQSELTQRSKDTSFATSHRTAPNLHEHPLATSRPDQFEAPWLALPLAVKGYDDYLDARPKPPRGADNADRETPPPPPTSGAEPCPAPGQ